MNHVERPGVEIAAHEDLLVRGTVPVGELDALGKDFPCGRLAHRVDQGVAGRFMFGEPRCPQRPSESKENERTRMGYET